MSPRITDKDRPAGGTSVDEFLQEVIDTFDGQVVYGEVETFPLPLEEPTPGRAPRRGCNGCRGREFHKIQGRPEWICSTCHSVPLGLEVEETWTAPEPSLFEVMNRRRDRTKRLGLRGLGKRRARRTGGRHD